MSNYNEVIYDMLSNAAAITALVSTRIYPVVIDQDQGTPAIAFRKSITPTNTKGNETKVDNVEVELNVIATTPDAADTICQEIRTVLDNQNQATIAGFVVTRIQFNEQMPESYAAEENLFLIPIKYSMKIWRA